MLSKRQDNRTSSIYFADFKIIRTPFASYPNDGNEWFAIRSERTSHTQIFFFFHLDDIFVIFGFESLGSFTRLSRHLVAWAHFAVEHRKHFSFPLVCLARQ